MKKKVLAIFLISVMGLSVLTACGETKDSEKKKEENKSETGVVSLKVWGAEGDQALIKQLCNNFAAQYSDTTFEFTFEAVEEGDARGAALNDVANAADVFSFADDQLASFAASGIMSPVVNADEVTSANSESSIEAATVNGVLYAYPMTADNGYFMYYDKSVFTDETALATMDGLLEAASKAGKTVYFDMGSGWYNYSFFGNTGLEVGLNADGISNYCTWNSTENAITGVDVLKAMMAICSNAGFSKDLSVSLVDGAKSGTYCAGVSGVWDAASLTEIWGDNLGATKLPTYTVNGGQIQMASFAGYKLIGVNAYSKNLDWAHKLADWLTNENSQMERFTQRALGPSNKNAAASSAVAQSVALKALLSQNPYSKLQRIGGNYWSPASDIGNCAINNNSSGQDLQTFLDDCVEKITKSNAD